MKTVIGATLEGSSNMKKIPDKYVLKETKAHMLKIKFHYNGYFVSDPETTYKKGKSYELKKGLDIDQINIIDLGKQVKELLGVTGEFKLWYGKPENDLSDGLRLLGTDRDVI
ncbi:zinc knuckle family protein, partial [Trifolium pratense]